MPTTEGCRNRRQRLLEILRPSHPIVLGDPLHLRYFAGCYVDPFSLGADFSALLRITPDGGTTLFHDNRLPKSVERSHVDQRIPIRWYDGKSPGIGPRRLILQAALADPGTGGRIHDFINDPMAERIHSISHELRRRKDPDEIETMMACMKATELGQAWAREHIKPGMTELEVYTGVFSECTKAVGYPVIVYGDFSVSPGKAKRGGMGTDRIINAGETFILDYSVIIDGYRSDFTNTLVVGAAPTAEQQRTFELCLQAMKAGESRLRAGVTCLEVYKTVRGVFEAAGCDSAFPHHAGHGLGLSHPEAPFFVQDANEVLVAGDVVTLEPGLYIDGVGGVRIEHNYLITATGFEQLSHHTLGL